MIRKAYIRNQARKESYLRERREGKKWSIVKYDKSSNKIGVDFMYVENMSIKKKIKFNWKELN